MIELIDLPEFHIEEVRRLTKQEQEAKEDKSADTEVDPSDMDW